MARKKSGRKRENQMLGGMVVRYVLMILTAVPNLWIFYFIFTPLTVYPSYYLAKLFFSGVSLMGTTIFIGRTPIQLIEACIAGAAYYLLFILNLSVPGINAKKRIRMILLSFVSLLALNLIRIAVLMFIFVSGYSFFDLAHAIFWYALSTLFVIGIWFAEVKIFSIKNIPVYSDIKFLLKKTRPRK